MMSKWGSSNSSKVMINNCGFHYRTETNTEQKGPGVARGGWGGGGGGREFGVSRFKILHLEWISNEVLLYSTETISNHF